MFAHSITAPIYFDPEEFCSLSYSLCHRIRQNQDYPPLPLLAGLIDIGELSYFSTLPARICVRVRCKDVRVFRPRFRLAGARIQLAEGKIGTFSSQAAQVLIGLLQDRVAADDEFLIGPKFKRSHLLREAVRLGNEILEECGMRRDCRGRERSLLDFPASGIVNALAVEEPFFSRTSMNAASGLDEEQLKLLGREVTNAQLQNWNPTGFGSPMIHLR